MLYEMGDPKIQRYGISYCLKVLPLTLTLLISVQSDQQYLAYKSNLSMGKCDSRRPRCSHGKERGRNLAQFLLICFADTFGVTKQKRLSTRKAFTYQVTVPKSWKTATLFTGEQALTVLQRLPTRSVAISSNISRSTSLLGLHRSDGGSRTRTVLPAVHRRCCGPASSRPESSRAYCSNT
jgi:hypothetical protein